MIASMGHILAESVIVVLKLNKELADQFPDKTAAPDGEGDSSPPHITLYYHGPLDTAYMKKFEDAVRAACAFSMPIQNDWVMLDGIIRYFEQEEQRVAYVQPFPPEPVAILAERILAELSAVDLFSSSEWYEDPSDYEPHATVAYLPLDGVYEGDAPVGPIDCDSVEIWGLGSPIVVPLGMGYGFERLEKGYVRSYQRQTKKGAVTVKEHYDKRTKKPVEPPKERKQAAMKRPDVQIERRGNELKGRVKMYADKLRDIANGTANIDYGRFSKDHVVSTVRRQLGHAMAQLHQHRIDYANAVSTGAGAERQYEKLQDNANAFARAFRANGMKMDGLELEGKGGLHAKVSAIPGGGASIALYDEYGVSKETPYPTEHDAAKALITGGFTKPAAGKSAALEGTTKWQYGTLASKMAKRVKALASSGQQFAAGEMERQWLAENGNDEAEFSAKRDAQQQIARIYSLGKKAWPDVVKSDRETAAAKAAEVHLGEAEGSRLAKPVKQLAMEELLDPKQIRESIELGLGDVNQDGTTRRLRKLVAGAPMARLRQQDIGIHAKAYVKQLEDHFGDLDSTDPDNIFEHLRGQIGDPSSERAMLRIFGKEAVAYLKAPSGPARQHALGKYLAKAGSDAYGRGLLEKTIRFQANQALRTSSSAISTDDISLPFALAREGQGEDINLPAYMDARLPAMHDAMQDKAGIEHALTQDYHRENWGKHFDTLVDTSRKILALQHLLKDPDFFHSDDGNATASLLDHLSKRREELFGVKTSHSKHGDLNFAHGHRQQPEDDSDVPF